VLDRIVNQGGWDLKDLQVMADAEVNEYVDLFKSLPGNDISKYIQKCISIGSIDGQSELENKIEQNTRAALRQIGSSSVINARRMEQYGIQVEQQD